MERLERIYEKGPGFLRDVFQYLFPGILFLSFMTLICFATRKDLSILLEVDFISLFKKYSHSSGFFIFIVILFLVFAYFMGVLFMELGELRFGVRLAILQFRKLLSIGITWGHRK